MNRTNSPDFVGDAENRGKRVTLMSIAREAGVSHKTVSAALRGLGSVSKGLREKILRIAEDQGYRPNVAAQTLRAQKSDHIGLILPGNVSASNSDSGPTDSLLGRFLDICEQRQQKYHIEFYRPTASGEMRPPVHLSTYQVDGVIVGGFVDAGLRRWLAEKSRAPWVSLHEPGPYAFIDAVDLGVGGAVDYLYQLGHRRFAYFGRDIFFTGHQLARDGFVTACRRLGMRTADSTCFMVAGAGHENFGAVLSAEVKTLFTGPERPTAVLCHGFDIARVVQLAAAVAGYLIPADFSLVVLGSQLVAVQGDPKMSVIEADAEGMMEMAITTLQKLVAKEFCESRTVAVPTRFISMESVSPPASR